MHHILIRGWVYQSKSLTSELNQILGLDPFFKGILVGALVTDGPAEEAGVQGRNGSYFGDIITAP